MRTRLRPALAGLLLLIPAAPVASAPAEEPAAEETSTGWVTELKVKAALLDKLGKDGLAIRVTLNGTEAILSGEVAERSAQELAEEVALSVEGVASVTNRIRTADGGGTKAERAGKTVEQEVEDARLESRVKLKLFAELGRHARPLEVEAVDGVVSLRGELPDRARKQIALDTARGAGGVRKVIDLLKVRR